MLDRKRIDPDRSKRKEVLEGEEEEIIIRKHFVRKNSIFIKKKNRNTVRL